MNCKICGTQFDAIRETQVTCSEKCREKWRSKNRIRTVKPMASITYTCKYCGKDYHPKTKDRMTYCSRECAYADKKAKPKVKILHKCKCVVCGKEFEGRANSKCCSDDCKKEIARRKQKEYWDTKKAASIVNEHVTKICKECGKTFTTNTFADRRLFCSEKCLKKNGRHSQAGILSRKLNNQTRRARLRGAKVESFNSIEIFERDGWHCQLCGEVVDKGLSHPHSLSPTLDHIIPLAKGGSHERENVQLAHFICNSRKGDRLTHTG